MEKFCKKRKIHKEEVKDIAGHGAIERKIQEEGGAFSPRFE